MSLICFHKTKTWTGLGHSGLLYQHFLVASSVPTEYRLLLEHYPTWLQRLQFLQSRFSTTPPVQFVKRKFYAIPLTFLAASLQDHQALDFLLLCAPVFRICRGFWTSVHLSRVFWWHPSAALMWFCCASFDLLFSPCSPGFIEDCRTCFLSTFPGFCSLAG